MTMLFYLLGGIALIVASAYATTEVFYRVAYWHYLNNNRNRSGKRKPLFL
jgi:hypothetical protein